MNLQDQGILPNKEEGSRGQRCKKVFADSELSLFRELPEWTPDAEVDGTGRGGGWRLFKQLQLDLLLEYAEETIRCGE